MEQSIGDLEAAADLARAAWIDTLKLAAKRRKLTRQQLGEAVFLSKSTVDKWFSMNSRLLPETAVVQLLCEKLEAPEIMAMYRSVVDAESAVTDARKTYTPPTPSTPDWYLGEWLQEIGEPPYEWRGRRWTRRYRGSKERVLIEHAEQRGSEIVLLGTIERDPMPGSRGRRWRFEGVVNTTTAWELVVTFRETDGRPGTGAMMFAPPASEPGYIEGVYLKRLPISLAEPVSLTDEDLENGVPFRTVSEPVPGRLQAVVPFPVVWRRPDVERPFPVHLFAAERIEFDSNTIVSTVDVDERSIEERLGALRGMSFEDFDNDLAEITEDPLADSK